jgi:hypothetical protein
MVWNISNKKHKKLSQKGEFFYLYIIGKTKCAKNFRYGFQFLAGEFY